MFRNVGSGRHEGPPAPFSFASRLCSESRSLPAQADLGRVGAMQRYICIHGHFYQPPRENPWLDAVELQESASPYHDWNERVTAECYLPNGAARILDGDCRIVRIVNNYTRISFDFGPTLLSWLERGA